MERHETFMWTMTEEKVKPTNAELKKILNIGIKLSTEKNREHLLASILETEWTLPTAMQVRCTFLRMVNYVFRL